MSQITVTLSANAGVALGIGGHRIWVDALHEEAAVGFSTLTPALQREMMAHPAFSHPEHICYTHLHPDHYSARLTAVARQLWPNARVAMPGDSFSSETLQIRYFPLPHEGERYAGVAHYGILIRCDGWCVLIPGDCETASPALAEAIAGQRVDLALMDFPWITLRKGREFLERYLPDARILAYHLPFAADDVNGYRRSAAAAAADMAGVRLLMEPLETITIKKGRA